MPAKNLLKYIVGKQIEADESNKDAVRLAYINTIMFWIWRILIVLTSGGVIKFLMKLLGF
jgi:hypothetical protein